MKYPSLTPSQQLGINAVISGEAEKFEAENVCPNAIEEHMKSRGYTAGEFDTNGWDYDWWFHFTKGDEAWTATGSGYYGWFAFGKTEA